VSVADEKRRAAISRRRRPVIAVIGSGHAADPSCAEVGRLIATLGFDLLTGGGLGVMEAVSRAFFETPLRRGLVIGILPGSVAPLEALEAREPSEVSYTLRPGYPNEWVEIAIYTHLPDSGLTGTLRSSRNHINVLSADAAVALPGQHGTISEVWLATQYGVPVIAFGDHPDLTPYGIARARSLDQLREFLQGVKWQIAD
jgi:predicted Rossmann-fold nucleotide-binding protein